MNNNRKASPAMSSSNATDMAKRLIKRLGSNDSYPLNTAVPDKFSDKQEMIDLDAYCMFLDATQVGKDICKKIKSENDLAKLAPKTNKEVLLGGFEEEVLKKRFVFLYRLMTKFLDTSSLRGKLYICEGKLDHVVIDYFADIYWLKQSHNIKRVGRQTIYAYLAFWIVRRQPFQVLEDYATEEGCVFANEYFATSLLVYYFYSLSFDVDNGFPSIKDPKYDEFQKHVLYHLKYRLMDAHNLELLIASYETGYRVG